MRSRQRNLLKDRSGISSTATALLFSIIAMLIFMVYMDMPGKAMEIALAFFDFFTEVKVLPPNFNPREFLDSPTGQLAAYFTSTMCMVLIIVVIFNCIKWPMEIVTTILAWRRTRREKQRRIVEGKDVQGRKFEIEDKLGFSTLQALSRISKQNRSVSLDSVERKSVKAGEFDEYKGLLTTEWWQIRGTRTLTLEKGKLKEMILEAKKLFPTEQNPQGSLNELAKVLGIGNSQLYEIVRKDQDTMTSERLQTLLDVIEVPYEVITPYIKAVGGGSNKEAIRNPRFPFNMNSPDGGRLLASSLKDGHISKERHRFIYSNYDPENRRIITETVQRIFGDIEPGPTFDREGKQNGIRFTSVVVGDVLLKAGAVEGRKTEQDFGLPPMIKFGSYALVNAYFEHSIRDDGNRNYKGYQIYLSSAQEIQSKVNPELIRIFEYLPWEETHPNSQVTEFYVNLKEGLELGLPDELRAIYEDFLSKMRYEWAPTIVKEEKESLEKTYGVKARIDPKKIYIGEKHGLRGEWHITVTGKADFEKMVRQLDSIWEVEGDGER